MRCPGQVRTAAAEPSLSDVIRKSFNSTRDGDDSSHAHTSGTCLGIRLRSTDLTAGHTRAPNAEENTSFWMLTFCDPDAGVVCWFR